MSALGKNVEIIENKTINKTLGGTYRASNIQTPRSHVFLMF